MTEIQKALADVQDDFIENNGDEVFTRPDEDFRESLIQTIAAAIQHRTGIDENRAIGAAQEVFDTVLRPVFKDVMNGE